ncbi:hypothetical protein ACXYXJ_11980 [Escherichia coli]
MAEAAAEVKNKRNFKKSKKKSCVICEAAVNVPSYIFVCAC